MEFVKCKNYVGLLSFVYQSQHCIKTTVPWWPLIPASREGQDRDERMMWTRGPGHHPLSLVVLHIPPATIYTRFSPEIYTLCLLTCAVNIQLHLS